MTILKPSSKKMTFEYFSLKVSGGDVDLANIFSSMSTISDRKIIECDGRPFLFSYIEKIDGGIIPDCWYVETIRFRRACYPVLLNSKGEELDNSEIPEDVWFGEKSAFLCSPSKMALVLLQNKHGVRSLCISEGVTLAAKRFGPKGFSGEIRLIGLSKSIGSPANEIIKSQHVDYYTQGVFCEGDEIYAGCSAKWMAKQLANRNVRDMNLKKISMTAKSYEVRYEKIALIDKIPFLSKTIDYEPVETVGNAFPEIDMNDLNKDALVWVIERQEHTLRYLVRSEMKKLLIDAWNYKPFQEGFLNDR